MWARRGLRQEVHRRPFVDSRGLSATAAWWSHTENVHSASHRLRCLRIVTALRVLGVEVGLYRAADGVPPRCLVLMKRYDPGSMQEAISLRKRAGTRLVLDLCDNHFHFEGDEPALRRRAATLREAVRAVDHVVASSPALAEVIQSECGAEVPVSVIPDATEPPFVPTRLARSEHPIVEEQLGRLATSLRRSGIPRERRLLWFGIHGTFRVNGGMIDLLRIREALHDAHGVRPLSLTVVSNDEAKFEAVTQGWALPTYYLPWHPQTFSRIARLHSAVVVPISVNAFTQCKTNNRPATGFLHGLNVLADAIPSYQEFSDCAVLDDWRRGLGDYLDDLPRRAADVAAGRRLLAQRYSLEVVAAQWHALVAP
jgi:hypothetical protein